MVSASRLQRLQEIVSAEVSALPDKPAISDDDESGGVPLDPEHTIAPPATHSDAHGPAEGSLAPHSVEFDENLERRFEYIQGAVSSYNLASSSSSSPKPPVALTGKLPPTNWKQGDVAPIGQAFAPILALSKYPYKFCEAKYKQDVASSFFDGGKFWAREWDLFYVWDIEPKTKPLVLVSEGQFQQFLDEINSSLKLRLSITDEQREDNMVARFPDHPRCLPRYLGRSRSREEYNAMVGQAQAFSESLSQPMDKQIQDDFEQMMQDLTDQSKGKNKMAQEKKRQDRLGKQKTFADQFKRAGRYLGLRPLEHHAMSPIRCDLPVPYHHEADIVFLCADVESYERAHGKITEIGLASLDTRDLANVAPGEDGSNWRTKIHVRHIRIKEHMHLVNSEFVTGCPDRFDFGTSEIVSLKDAPHEIAACFESPFCNIATSHAEEKRKIVFVGHDTVTDIRYLRDLGFHVLEHDSIVETIDTATIFRVWRQEQQPTRLGRILYELNIDGFNLHNAGNDAAFTLQAMLACLVREAVSRK